MYSFPLFPLFTETKLWKEYANVCAFSAAQNGRASRVNLQSE